MSTKFIDLTGKKFGRLTVLKRTENWKDKHIKWDCICDCGNMKATYGQCLRESRVVSCGCYRKELKPQGSKTHGLCKTIEYQSWVNMLSRCNNENHTYYKNYGGRGITVCDRWRNDFSNFIQDMGNRPSKQHSIDRIDVNGNYEPSNCVWATKSEQAQNKRKYTNNTSGVSGVTLKNGRWQSRITVNNKRMNLGYYDDIVEAISARKEAEIKYWNK